MNALIVYYSRADENYWNGQLKVLEKGNTEIVAEKIQKNIGAPLFSLEPVQEYDPSYNTCIEQARQDLMRDARPECKQYPDLQQVDTLYLGFPNYWSTMPMCVWTFLEKYDLSNKKIFPFCTHEGSGFGRSLQDLEKLCPQADIQEGFSVQGASASKCDGSLDAWIKGGINHG